ncbi:MAG: PLP-dependent aminotransferase family protein, partial [Ottowia sp.]|nr:PLP-dependent aminotransferase family protein [Ottowia sp.]
MPYPFATRLDHVETSAIRELFKVLGRPGIISFAGGFPDSALFDVEGVARAAAAALEHEPAAALQYCASEGYAPLREELARLMRAAPGAPEVQPPQLMVTTGSQQAIDLLAKILLEPGSTAFVEAPTFLSAIQCFRLYGARVIGVPIDADGVQPDALEALITQHQPRLVYLIPSFSNPSGATLTLERRLRVLEIAARTHTLIVEDDPYGAVYFDAPPPPSLLALSAQVPGSRDYVAHCGSLSKTLSP